jgi:glycosyltransferase involved in cell wall biosynthesis
MNFLVVSAYYHPAEVYGGPVRSMHQRSLALARLGHTVNTLTTNANGAGDLAVTTVEPVLVDGLPVLYCPRFWFGMKRKPHYLFFSPALKRRLQKLKTGDFDMILVHAAWTDPGRLVWIASRRTGIPFIYYTHGCFEPWALNHKFWKKRLYWHLDESRILQGAAGVVVCNRAEEQVLRDLGVTIPVKRIPWGIHLPPDQPPSRPQTAAILFSYLKERPYVLFLSRLHPKKGLDLLIPAFAALAQEFPEWLLVLAGPDEGGTEAQVRRQVGAHGLEDRVIFTGMVSGEMKHALLSQAEFFVLPSYSEGFPMVVAEALAYGLPVVITTTCHVPEVGERQAGLVVPVDQEALTASLQEMMRNENLRRSCGRNAFSLAQENFTWEKVAEQSLTFYQECVRNHSTV